jgi:uncharacterized protein
MVMLTRTDAPGRIHLLGSVHAGLQRFYPLPEPVERAFGQADRLLVELDIAAQSDAIRIETASVSLLPDGRTLDQVLQPETLEALKQAFHARPWALRSVQRLQPWALALLLPNDDDVRLDADPRDGVDLHLVRRAHARSLPVVELETVAAQLRAFAGGSLEEQEAALARRLAQRRHQDRSFVRIVDAWRRGDLSELAVLKDHAYPPEGVLAGLRERLFAERDAVIADRLAEALRDPAPGFATIGVLHLAGPDAIQTMLVRRGVTVRPADDPA